MQKQKIVQILSPYLLAYRKGFKAQYAPLAITEKLNVQSVRSVLAVSEQLNEGNGVWVRMKATWFWNVEIVEI